MDRNVIYLLTASAFLIVALRKESVDRNVLHIQVATSYLVALRKESVDRNVESYGDNRRSRLSLSVRRAWIEIKIKNNREHKR